MSGAGEGKRGKEFSFAGRKARPSRSPDLQARWGLDRRVPGVTCAWSLGSERESGRRGRHDGLVRRMQMSGRAEAAGPTASAPPGSLIQRARGRFLRWARLELGALGQGGAAAVARERCPCV